MTHQDLCELALKWLKRPWSRQGHGCAVALSECRSGWDGESPDAIGFRATGHMDGSVVVEAKVSRADFLADINKPHRVQGGMGNWRYYIAPANLIDPNELVDRWGLLEVNQRGHIKIVSGAAVHLNSYRRRADELLRWKHEANREREQFLLTRALANTGDPQKTLNMLREANRMRNYALAERDRLRDELKILRGQHG